MDDTYLEKRANRASDEVTEVIVDLIDQVNAYETIVEDYQNTISKLEGDAEHLADTLNDTIKQLQQSELERLELVQLIKQFKNVDI